MDVIWKSFRDTKYSISNTGLVRNDKSNRILKSSINENGYKHVVLSNNGIPTTHKVHKLVAEVYLNHIPCKHVLVVNHIDHDRTNNNVDNLEIVTMRENTNRLHLESTSKYVGVSMQKRTGRWLSHKMINGKRTHLGIFNTEEEAHDAYLNN